MGKEKAKKKKKFDRSLTETDIQNGVEKATTKIEKERICT